MILREGLKNNAQFGKDPVKQGPLYIDGENVN